MFNNLKIAFPEKSEEDRKKIARQFYKNLIDTFIETIKLLSISERNFNKRAVVNVDECNNLTRKGLNVQFQSGHQMNWEYANWAVSKKLESQMLGIYMGIHNQAIDRIFFNLRKKYGTVLLAATEFKTRGHHVFDKQYTLGLVADQNPGVPKTAYWLNFFSKAAPFITGPDKGARKNNTAVVFVKMIKIKRGYYRFEPKVITENASLFPEGKLTLLYRDFLEQTIREHPDNYLWSHRRWKWDWKNEYHELWIDVVPAPIDNP